MPGHPFDDTSVTLMERLQKFPADPRAWDEFVERYRPMIRAWCLKWNLQDADADDVVQDVLVKLVAAIRKFRYDPARSFRAWLKTITHHALSDFVASRGKDPGRAATPIEGIVESVGAKTDLEQQLADAFDAEVLEMAMHRVKKRVKAVTWDAFQLTVVEGLSGAAAGEKLQIPIARVFVAKNRVQQMLQDEARILKKNLS
jgi:RNA polymerase sigma factor (sigma-70 family)